MSGNDPWAKHKAATPSEAPSAPAAPKDEITQAEEPPKAKARKTLSSGSSKSRAQAAESVSQPATRPDQPPGLLTCPKCHEILTEDGRNWRCADGHSYDTAKQGYVNLLLVDQKKSKHPGDDMDMVRARADFLDGGDYLPISDALNTLLAEQLGETKDQKMLDIGCGDGWYTVRMAAGVSALGQITGLDISRDAVRYATRRDKSIRWIVASGARPPLQAKSQNAIVTLFTPLMPQGLEHALTDDGVVITASTGANHLSQLRERIYTQVNEDHWSPVSAMQSAGFACTAEQHVRFTFRPADNDALLNLLNMTPHRWKVAPEKADALKDMEPFDIEVDVTLHAFRRQNGQNDPG